MSVSTSVTIPFMFVSFLNNVVSVVPAPKSLVMVSMQNCPDVTEALSRYEDLIISEQQKGVFLLNGRQDVYEELDNITLLYVAPTEIGLMAVMGQEMANIEKEAAVELIKVSVELTRCASSRSQDSCERTASFAAGSMCPRLEESGQFYSAFFGSMNPPLRCPVKPGSYNITDAPVSSDISQFFPLQSGFFKVRLEARMGERLAICEMFEVQVSPKRTWG